MKYFRVSLQWNDFTNASCGQHTNTTPVSPGGSATFNCDGASGQVVRIAKLPGHSYQDLITLCEVEVKGTLYVPNSTTNIPTDTTPYPAAVFTTPFKSGNLHRFLSRHVLDFFDNLS